MEIKINLLVSSWWFQHVVKIDEVHECVKLLWEVGDFIPVALICISGQSRLNCNC